MYTVVLSIPPTHTTAAKQGADIPESLGPTISAPQNHIISAQKHSSVRRQCNLSLQSVKKNCTRFQSVPVVLPLDR